jgi:quinol monooxygenase YgiN
MYARVTILRGHCDKLDAAQQFWVREVLPALRLQPGFKRLLVVADRGSGKSYAVTLWETEADEQASMRSDYMQELIARADAWLVEPPIFESYEVIASSTVD